jgi:thioester reductase-like protein
VAALTFFTGAPGFIGTRIVRRLLEADAGRRLALLVYPDEKLLEKARRLAALPLAAGRVEVVPGDIARPRLGLDDATYARLVAETTEAWHLAALYHLAAPRDRSVAVNVDGTRGVLDLCEAAPGLARLVYFSTIVVSGDRTGTVYERELDMGQSFRNHYESTKFEAEVLVRRRPGIPTTIIRPAVVIGDSRTGEIDKYDGPYYFIYPLAKLEAERSLGPLAALYGIGSAPAPFHLVPVDYLVAAATEIARRPDTAGKTFHIVDRDPLTVSEFRAAVLRRFGVPQVNAPVPAAAVRALLRVPRVADALRIIPQVFDYVDLDVRYDDTNTRRALEGSGLTCPRLPAYLDRLVAYVRAHLEIRPLLS